MSKEDERNKTLIKRIQLGDKEALQTLCRVNYGFVKMKATKYFGYYGSDLSEEELIQEGMIGLIIAARRFDLERDNSFLTYAGWYIEYYVRKSNIIQGFTIKLPDNIFPLIGKISKADELYQHLHGQERIKAISEHLNISEQRILSILQYTNYIHLARADKPLDTNDENMRLKDFFSYNRIDGTSFVDVEKEVEYNELCSILFGLMERILTEIELTVLLLRFGFVDNIPHTLADISKGFGVTSERIRQVEKKALRKLRRHLGWKGLELNDFIKR